MISTIIIASVYLIIISIFIYKFLSTEQYKYFALAIGTYFLCAVTFITIATLGMGYR